ncbi:MAG TPA: metalloregulator ArsR/SmtB family transcription factor [Thermomicrobiales bacterium]|jgi:DNA-binding transcriptional ArsR family regulator|nr:metalloregulator ArsR/SmtB family transcription factor [Thermomicrobiales bacterium]
MCAMMHMTNEATSLEQPDDCDVPAIHPRQVMAARVRLAGGPAAEDVARLFAILGDPTRVRLLAALGTSELCVCDLAAATGVNRSTVSHQLRILREYRIVRRRRDGKVIYYALDDGHVASLLAMGTEHVAEAIGEDQSKEQPA